MLTLRQLHVHYGHVHALRGIDLDVEKGEIVTLIGANGAGKSTLMTSILGSPRPSAGELSFKGRSLAGLAPHQVARQGIAIAPEGRRIYLRMTVLENLLMGSIHADPKGREDDLQRMYDLFPILQTRLHQTAGTLSGGEQQMLAIARALMSHPQLLLLDEPSLGLAPIYIQKVFQIIRRLNSELGMTILLVEQNARQALAVAHRGYVLQHGEIVMQGTGQALAGSAQVRAAYLEAGHKVSA